MKQDEVLDAIEMLENLKKQATLERSHYYVLASANKALAALYEYLLTFGENTPPEGARDA